MESLTYELTQHAPDNLDSFLDQLEFHFTAYLKGHHSNQEEKDFLKSLVKSKGGISSLIKDVYKNHFIFEPQKELSLNELKKILEEMSDMGGRMYELLPEEEKVYFKIHGGDSMIGVGGKYYFQNPNVTTQDISILENFFRWYLVQKFIVETPETQEKLDQQFASYLLANMIRNELLPYTFYVEHILKIKKAKEITLYLLLILHNANDISKEDARTFMESIENGALQEKSDAGINAIGKVIKTLFPNIYTKDLTQYKVRSILLGTYDEKKRDNFSFHLLPEDNFYFRKDEEQKGENDIFPENGQMLRLYDERTEGKKDICIFTPDGHKVFRGDIGRDDIKNIMGTYYILSQNEGWREVPEYATGNVTCLTPVQDPIFDTIRQMNPATARLLIPNDVLYLLPDYVRGVAIGKIEKGQYFTNPRQIQL